MKVKLFAALLCVSFSVAMSAQVKEAPMPELVRHQDGQYDFSSVKTIIDEARRNDIRLVLLWFATWKNGSGHYMPEWMKLDSKKYYNVVGAQGQPVDSPSPHCKAAMELDAKAFAAVMEFIRDYDPCRTVIMMQVHMWASSRQLSV